eukprot:430840_1
MGAVSNCCSGASNKTSLEKGLLNKSKTNIKKQNKESFHIAFNECCLPKSQFQCTMVTTKKLVHTKGIELSSKNYKFSDLSNANERIADATKLSKNGEFYLLIREYDRDKGLDEHQIQKYKIFRNKTGSNKIEIKFIENVCNDLLKGESVNGEGLEIIESMNDNKIIGFLMCNDIYANPKNSNIYYLNLKYEAKIIHSLNDEGVAELNGILHHKAFGKDGYFILPQFLCLVGADRNWDNFAKFVFENKGKGIIYFVDRKNLLKVIRCNDDKKR